MFPTLFPTKEGGFIQSSNQTLKKEGPLKQWLVLCKFLLSGETYLIYGLIFWKCPKFWEKGSPGNLTL